MKPFVLLSLIAVAGCTYYCQCERKPTPTPYPNPTNFAGLRPLGPHERYVTNKGEVKIVPKPKPRP